MPPLSLILSSLASFWHDGRRIERAAYVAGALMLLSGLTHLAILIGSGGSWEGPLSWRKPTTFGFSFGLTAITIAWVSSFLRLGDRARTMLVGTFTVACVLETALVSLQTWRGVPSHFNVETSTDALVARFLAGGGAVLIAILLTLTVASFRTNPAVPPSMRLAIRVGLVALVAAQAVGGLMIARGMGLVFSGHRAMAYATGGALKPAHATTMHGIQLLPVLAWLLSLTGWSEQHRLRVVLLAAVGYVLVAGAIVAVTMATT